MILKGGMIIDKTKKIKWNNKTWNIRVSTYNNNRICLKMINKNKEHEITINMPLLYLENGHIFLNPETEKNGLLPLFIKKRVIKNIVGVAYDGYIGIPVGILNMGILRQYDYMGVTKHIQKVTKGESDEK